MSQRNLDRMPYGEKESSLYDAIQERLPDLDIVSGDDPDGEPFPVEASYDADGLEGVFEDADGVYRELPISAWDPTLTLDHVEEAYLDADEAVTELEQLSEEWSIEETDVSFYHNEGLRVRGTVRMSYEGGLPAETEIEMPFRVDVEQYLPEDAARDALEDYGL
jgi:hypothetical protein